MDQNGISPQEGNGQAQNNPNMVPVPPVLSVQEQTQTPVQTQEPSITPQVDLPPTEPLSTDSGNGVLPQAPLEPTKKSSPVLVIALILLIASILFLGGYYLWINYFAANSQKSPIVTMTPTVKPTIVPTMTPEATVSATPTSTASATPTSSASPSASPE